MVYLLFLASGASSLIYQVIWVRAFGHVFGNTIYSASIVVAVFMLGLGAGGYVGGRWADRHDRGPGAMLRAFAVVEFAIGGLALALSTLLPHLTTVSAALSAYVRGPEGWYELSIWSQALRALLAAGLLTPITPLMGATLTLLIRHVAAGDLEAGRWRIAVLYAVNTAGAAAGCFLTDHALVPAVGLSGTQATAFLLNGAAGVGALVLARRLAAGGALRPGVRPSMPETGGSRSRPARRRVPAAAPAVPPSPAASPIGWTGLAIALSGFAAMGMEIVWFRHFTILLGEYRAVFSLLLTVVLAGIAAGSMAGGWLYRRTGQPARVWMIVQGGFAVAALAGLAAVDAQAIAAGLPAGAAGGWAQAWTEVWFNARPLLPVVAAPAILMGFAFPLANAVVQQVEARIGRRAGALYLANTAGAVAGSLAAGFVLLPAVGIQQTAALLAGAAALAIVPLYLAVRREHPPLRPAAAPLAAAAAAIVAWVQLPPDFLLSRALRFPLDRAYAVSEGVTEVVAVTDGPNGGRVLVTNGHPMSSTELFSQRYMRAMAHIPLLSLDRPERVLVICFGVGNTAHAAALHPTVARVDVVDLSKHVLRHADYFREVNQDVLRDPRVTVYVNDGRHHLQMAAAVAFDLITLEPPPIVHAGVAALYSREFYAAARARLAPGGYISQWLPAFGVPHDTILSMARAFVEVFPGAVLLSGAHTNLLLLGARDAPVVIDPEHLSARLAAAPAVQADLARVDLGTPRDIAGTFVASARTLAAATRTVPPLTDDRPIQEYGKRSLLDFGEGGIPPSLVAVDDVAAWCPSCFTEGRPAPSVAGLDRYLALADLAYRAPPSAVPGVTGRLVAGSGYLGSIVPESPELERILGDLSADPPPTLPSDLERQVRERYARATALLEAGEPAKALDELRLVLELAPGTVEALNNTGVALASLGRLDEAAGMFERAIAIRPDFQDARRNLERVQVESKK